jgi:hypothetical protein
MGDPLEALNLLKQALTLRDLGFQECDARDKADVTMSRHWARKAATLQRRIENFLEKHYL